MRLLLPILLVLPMLTPLRPAAGDVNLNCDAYAGAAVAQQQQNLAQSCGLGGPAWSLDFAAHRTWCLAPATKMENLTAEDEARRSALALCADKPKQEQAACQNYANRAVMIADAAIKQQCGLSGGRWSLDYGGHFDWCLGVPQAARDQEDKARTDQFDGCMASKAAAADKSLKDACGLYAVTAVNHQKENLGRQCGFTGGRWDEDWFSHFSWCVAVGPGSASQENALRTAALTDDCLYKVCKTEHNVLSTTTSCKMVPRPWQ
jgi:hypothetical protein